MTKLEQQYKMMMTIRCFEERMLTLFGQNKISGTTHTYIGQEATAVAVMDQVREEDTVFSNHRCHGHYLAYGGPIEKLMAEIMSKEGGICEGCGGSQHIHYKNLYSNGVQGGIVPNAAGVAWANKLLHKHGIAVVFIGDGTLGQGIVYETFNMASLYEIPVLFIIEDNGYAMSTKTCEGVAGSIAARPEAFGIAYSEIESTDVEVLDGELKKAFAYVREQGKPYCQIIHDYRLAAHSKGDDTRDPEEVKEHRKNDPLVLTGAKLKKEFCDSCREEIEKSLDEAQQAVEQQSYIDIEEVKNSRKSAKIKHDYPGANAMDIRCIEAINKALYHAVEKDDTLYMMGEDIKDPYGGAYKATRGLSGTFKGRIINTPISEAGFTGLGVGLALGGVKPVIEMMFGDFMTLSFDQILNHGTKYPWVYGVKVPMIIRAPMGGYRGYGPTHAQTLDKYFLGICGLDIMAVSPVHNVQAMYEHAISSCNEPLLIIENKKMYAEKLLTVSEGKIQDFFVKEYWNHKFPTIYLTLDDGSKPDVILLTYGGMTKMAMEAAKHLLLEREIQADIVVISQLSPLPMMDLRECMAACRKVVTVEEGTLRAGWGADILTALREENIIDREGRVAAKDMPLPNGIKLETQVLPSVNQIMDKLEEIYHD